MKWKLPGSLVAGAMVSLLAAAQPPVTGVSKSPSSGRIMGTPVRLQATIEKTGTVERPLVYAWSIQETPSAVKPCFYKLGVPPEGACAAEYSDSGVQVGFWWTSEAAAEALFTDGNPGNDQVIVRLQVQFADATEEDTPSTIDVVIPLAGVNHAPVPVITGRLGTPEERLPTGTAVNFKSYSSYDPDGDSFYSGWGLGSKKGGSYLGFPTLIGSEGPDAGFIVPAMTSPIDQEIILVLKDGLHTVHKSAWAYLRPGDATPPPSPGEVNTAPTVELAPSVLTVTPADAAVFVATGKDTNGDALEFAWLLDSGTVPKGSVHSIRLDSSTWRSTLTLPAQSLSLGTHQVSVQAKESATSQKLSSQRKFATLLVEGSKNQPPVAKIRYDVGKGWQGPIVEPTSIKTEARTIRLEARSSTDDQGSAQLTYGWAVKGRGKLSTREGPETVLTVTADVVGEVTVTLTAQDGEGLSDETSITFVFEASAQPPTARIRYRTAGGDWSEPLEPFSTVEVPEPSVVLDGTASSDEVDGATGLQYRWTVAGKAILSRETGPETTLTLQGDSVVTVTLTVTNAAQLSSSTTVGFRLRANHPPVAKVRIDLGSGWVGPYSDSFNLAAASNRVELDASSSEDPENAELAYSWSVDGAAEAELSNETGERVVLEVPDGFVGAVTVALTVRDPLGKEDKLTFILEWNEQPLAVEIVEAPAQVASGEDVALAARLTGATSEEVRFVWSAKTPDGSEVDVYSTGLRARLFAPAPKSLSEELLTVSVKAVRGDVESEPATAQILVTPPRLYFPQLAVGPIDDHLEFHTTVVLVNQSDREALGWVDFLRSPDGAAWSVRVDGSEQTEAGFSIPAEGAKKMVLTGDHVGVGWLRLVSNVPLTGHLFYQVIDRTTGLIVREVPILPTAGRTLQTALDRGPNSEVALALVNIGEEEVRYRLVVRSSDGPELVTDELRLGPGEHKAAFLGELFDGSAHSAQTIPGNFPGGTLTVEVLEGGARVAATLIKTDRGLPLSILPVAVR
ncbi:MAG: hypothetical protein Kow00109_22920 [Acidobacteriota bacterium]